MDRRKFMMQLGAAGLFMPMLPSLLLRAHAQPGRAPLRFIFIFSWNGQYEESYYPQVPNETAFSPHVHYKKLSEFPGSISTVFGPAFDSLKNEISILRGLDFCHGYAHGEHAEIQFLSSSLLRQGQTWVGRGMQGATIDWILQRSNAFYPTVPKLPAIRHIAWNEAGRSFSYKAVPNVGPEALPGLTTDRGIFDQVFGGFGSAGGSAGTSGAAMRALVADKARERLNSLKSHRRLSATDRTNLGEHLDVLTDIKARFESSTAHGCTVPSPEFIKSGDLRSKYYSNLFDTTISAFACDLTRISCINLTDYGDTEFAGGGDHSYSHMDPGQDGRVEFGLRRRWMADRVAELIRKLAARTDSDGTRMLDNTVVVWGSDMINVHKMESIPIMVAGNAQGKLRSGYYIDYRRRPFRSLYGPPLGVAYSQMLCTLMLAAGLQPAEIQSYAGPDGKFGHFELIDNFRLPQYFEPAHYQAIRDARNDALPYFYRG